MLTLDQMRNIAHTENVLFYKRDCLFCAASEKLFTELEARKILDKFQIYYLYDDFNDELLTELVKEFGWKPGSYQINCTKPQIFIQGKLIGGNFELYKSKWNRGESGTGKIEIDGTEIDTPNLTNPMRF